MATRFRLALAARRLHEGGVIAYPTEAVFGLGCAPLNRTAFERVLALKGRSSTKGVILIAATEAQLQPFLGTIDPEIRNRVSASWPGPVTWLMPPAAGVPAWLTGAHDTLAVRVTDHPIAAALCRAFGGPIVSTSANRSGHEPARSALRARMLFRTRLDDIVHGAVGGLARPTAILDARTGAVIRPG